MPASKRSINIIIACLVVLLGTTAAVFIYRNSERPEIRRISPEHASGGQMPASHPSVDFASMQAALEQLIAKDPQNANYRTQLANLYYDNGEYEKAAAAYQESLNLHPQDPGVETDLATCYYNLGQEDKALEILDRVLKYRPGFSQAMFNKGIVLISGKKDIKGGIAIWEELLRLDPVFAQKAELEQKIHQLKASVK